MALPKRSATALAVALSVVASLALAGTAFGADLRVVKVQDDCDQATFDAAVGPGTCVGDGRTTFQDFLAEFQAQGSVDRWAFSRPDFHVDSDGVIELVSEGGEVHTFTEVQQFGNGCIPLFDDPAAQPAFDCSQFPDGIVGASGVFPGTTRTIEAADLGPGVHLFQCAIHPWMRSVVEVRDKERGGRG